MQRASATALSNLHKTKLPSSESPLQSAAQSLEALYSKRIILKYLATIKNPVLNPERPAAQATQGSRVYI